LLGKVSDLDKKILYNTADVFVMPNIKVEGDIEGFGIVAIEASSVGLPVIAL
jgi:glycosyltransferase involved in cell wall biosynthesis